MKTKKKKYNKYAPLPSMYIKRNAGDPEKNQEIFNAAMTTGNPQDIMSGESQGAATGLAESVSNDRIIVNNIANDLLDINGPQYRGAPYPSLKKCAINESEIPDNMRAKEFSIDDINTSYGKDEVAIACTWITQEEFDEDDANDFIEEFQRAVEAICDKHDFDNILEINIEVICRDGREYGHYLDTIIYNGKRLKESKKESSNMNENLDNIVDVEEKSREVVDPAFGAAVREIKKNNETEEVVTAIKDTPKQGEEDLPEDTKITLDESLFTEAISSSDNDIEEIDVDMDTFYSNDHIKDIKDTIRKYFTGNISTFIDTLLEEASMADALDEILAVLDTIKEKIKLGD